MPGFLGVQEIAILGVILIVLFGAKRLPEMGRSLGTGLREFKDSVTGRVELEPVRDETVDDRRNL